MALEKFEQDDVDALADVVATHIHVKLYPGSEEDENYHKILLDVIKVVNDPKKTYRVYERLYKIQYPYSEHTAAVDKDLMTEMGAYDATVAGIAEQIMGNDPVLVGLLKGDVVKLWFVEPGDRHHRAAVVLPSFESPEEANYARRRDEDILLVQDVATYEPKMVTVMYETKRLKEPMPRAAVVVKALPRGVRFD